MDNLTNLPTAADAAEKLIGPKRNGNVLIVNGRAVPHVFVYSSEGSDSITFVIDERMAFDIGKDHAFQAAHMLAEGMAIASGYAHFGADEKRGPFASQVHFINELPEA